MRSASAVCCAENARASATAYASRPLSACTQVAHRPTLAPPPSLAPINQGSKRMSYTLSHQKVCSVSKGNAGKWRARNKHAVREQQQGFLRD